MGQAIEEKMCVFNKDKQSIFQAKNHLGQEMSLINGMNLLWLFMTHNNTQM